MHRQAIIQLLTNYEKEYPGLTVTKNFRQFVEDQENCFERSLEVGHVTGSAWIVDPSQKKVLLVHHKKLGLWLQPGGHCDGDADVARVAQKETIEETGLIDFKLFRESIFDLDIHQIPTWKDVSAHLHYDVRFLVHADSTQAIHLSSESNDLAWFKLHRLAEITTDDSVLRLAEKTAG